MRTATTLFLFVCLFSLTGCFEIVEQLFLKNDGSGDFQMVLNLSKSRTRLNSIMKMKTINGHDVPSKEEIRSRLTGIEKTVSKTPGISQVKTSIDFDNFIASINCNFRNVAALNNAVKNIYLKESPGGKKVPEKIYEYSGGVFQRWNKYSFKDDYSRLSNADKEIFATANYTAIFKFESAVSAASNKETKIAPSKKAVMLKLNTLDVIHEKKSIENKINLTN